MEGNDKDEDNVQEAATEPHTMESCLKRVRRVFEHEGENLKNSWVEAEAQDLDETIAKDASGQRFPVAISYHPLTKTYAAKIVIEEGKELVVNFGRFQQKEAKRKAKGRQWDYSHFLGRERRMLDPEQNRFEYEAVLEAVPRVKETTK